MTLKHLPAITFSLLLNFTTVIAAVIAIFTLREVPSRLQWLGMVIFIGGVLLYFLPLTTFGGSLTGFILAGITVCANALAAILGRSVNREQRIPPIVVTTISMGVGSIVLLACGLAFQGLPALSASAWLSVLWLAVVNTAFAFFLWNKIQRILSAVESSIINNTMLIQIAVLAWLFLGERLAMHGIVGLALAAVGILVVNLKDNRRADSEQCDPEV